MESDATPWVVGAERATSNLRSREFANENNTCFGAALVQLLHGRCGARTPTMLRCFCTTCAIQSCTVVTFVPPKNLPQRKVGAPRVLQIGILAWQVPVHDSRKTGDSEVTLWSHNKSGDGPFPRHGSLVDRLVGRGRLRGCLQSRTPGKDATEWLFCCGIFNMEPMAHFKPQTQGFQTTITISKLEMPSKLKGSNSYHFDQFCISILSSESLCKLVETCLCLKNHSRTLTRPQIFGSTLECGNRQGLGADVPKWVLVAFSFGFYTEVSMFWIQQNIQLHPITLGSSRSW